VKLPGRKPHCAHLHTGRKNIGRRLGEVTGFNQVSETSGPRGGVRHALAGVQAGILGALAMLACVMIGAAWNHRSVWSVPNLLATTFFGSDAYRNQLVRTSWSGVALILVIYGSLGMVWGTIFGDNRKHALAVYGAIAGLLVYFVFYDFLWRHANPLITLYAPDRQLEVAHLVWGLVLAKSPKYSRRIAESMIVRLPAEANLEEVQAISSGELIR
jgi:hypothetical protein